VLLAIDVGNTQTVIGLFGPEDPENKEFDLVDQALGTSGSAARRRVSCRSVRCSLLLPESL